MSQIPDGYYNAVATPVDTLEGPVFTQFMTTVDDMMGALRDQIRQALGKTDR